MKIWVELAPKKVLKCCYNCEQLVPWGCQTGHCLKFGKDKMFNEGKYCKNFDYKNEL